MGQTGDLLLVFADALTRSWKQIIKFKPEGTSKPSATPDPSRSFVPEAPLAATSQEDLAHELEGLIRDERGVRFARESDD